jgi:hypothetical protein
MRPVYKRHLIITGSIWSISLSLLLLIHFFVIVPQRKKLNDINCNVVKYRRQYKLAKEADVDAIVVEWKSELKELKKMFTKFVTDFEDSTSLSFAISRMLGDAGVSLSATIESPMSYSEIPGSEYLVRLNTRIQFTATFNQFAQVLNSLERYTPVFFVDKFSISRSSQAGRQLGQKVLMDLTSLVKKPTEQEDDASFTEDQNLPFSNSTADSADNDVK